MSMPTTDRERLAAIGLDADAPGLVTLAATDPSTPALAPQGIDPHMMAVSDIVFDAALLDEFADLDDVQARNAASRKVFDLYKSPGRNRDRNSLLHRKVGEFIGRVRVARKADVPSEHVKDKVRRAKPQSDLLQALAAIGITSVDDLAGLIDNS